MEVPYLRAVPCQPGSGEEEPSERLGRYRRDRQAWHNSGNCKERLESARTTSEKQITFPSKSAPTPKIIWESNGIKFRKQRETTQPIHSYDASISETKGKSKIAKTVVLPSPSWNTDKDEKSRLGELKLVRSVTLTLARFWGIWMSTSHSTLALSDKWNKILYFNLLLYSQPRAYNF